MDSSSRTEGPSSPSCPNGWRSSAPVSTKSATAVIPEVDPRGRDGKHRPFDALAVHHGQLVADPEAWPARHAVRDPVVRVLIDLPSSVAP